DRHFSGRILHPYLCEERIRILVVKGQGNTNQDRRRKENQEVFIFQKIKGIESEDIGNGRLSFSRFGRRCSGQGKTVNTQYHRYNRSHQESIPEHSLPYRLFRIPYESVADGQSGYNPADGPPDPDSGKLFFRVAQL